MLGKVVKNVRRSMSQVVQRLNTTACEVAEFGNHRKIDEQGLTHNTKTLQITPKIIQGWVRKVNLRD